MNAVEIIARKRDGAELSTNEIRFIVSGVVNEIVPDYQAAAWLMAVFLCGMSRRETLDLTIAMRDSGKRIDLTDLVNGPALDKHSTGGVGDKTSLVVVPILAAAGIPILKMSGRGLGFSGGTVDKLESIPGFRTDLSIDQAKDVVRRVGAVMIAQSNQLAPADKILYAIRDVTATIESIPLIAASIMSKKLAAGGRRILLDVKCGQGSFMKTRENADLLAQELVAIGNAAGEPTVAILTRMDEPVGWTVGNALEVREAIETMRSHAKTRSREEENALEARRTIDALSPTSCSPVSESPSLLFLDLCIELAAYGLVAAGKAANLRQGRKVGKNQIASGAAMAKFVEIVAAQGGSDSAHSILASLPRALVNCDVVSTQTGFIASMDAEEIGKLATEMGAGRHKKSDQVDHSVGIALDCKIGSKVLPGTRLATLHLHEQDIHRTDELATRLRSAYIITKAKPQIPESLVISIVR